MKTDKYFTRKATLAQKISTCHKDPIGPIGIHLLGKGRWKEFEVGKLEVKLEIMKFESWSPGWTTVIGKWL